VQRVQQVQSTRSISSYYIEVQNLRTAQEGKVLGNRANLIRNAKNAEKGEKKKGRRNPQTSSKRSLE